ncbi:MAG: hypothetical protein Q8Q62_00515 [Mesorhizobium sp.]|nr:hypothetical protein [Mesorhizobium sp.]
MKKLILASVSAIALFGVAACSDTDSTTTQSVEPPAETLTPMVPTDPARPAPQAAPDTTIPPAGEVAPSTE